MIRLSVRETHCISHSYLITTQLPMGRSDREGRKKERKKRNAKQAGTMSKANRYPDEILIATKDVRRLPRGSEPTLNRRVYSVGKRKKKKEKKDARPIRIPFDSTLQNRRRFFQSSTIYLCY